MSIRSAFLAICLFCLCLQPALGERRRVLILHTNDLHGHLEDQKGPGYVRLAGLIRSIRSAFPKQTLLLDGGDTSLGTPTSGLFFGQPMAKAMATLDYDAIAIGNHEFNWGQDKMRALTDAMKSPVLCANLVRTDGGPPPYPGWKILEHQDLKIGVIGLVTPDTPRRAPKEATQGWTFQQPEVAAKRAIQEMGDVDFVIALTHLGVEPDKDLAAAVPEIDLIVGGHSHTPLHQPVLVNKTMIVQSGCYAKFLGKLEVVLDSDLDAVELVDYRLVSVTEETGQDPKVAAIAEEYAAKVAPMLNRVAGQVSSVVANTPDLDSYDTPLGNLIADVFRSQTKADVALYNRGGVRSDMPSGPLTVRAIHKLFPFNDPVLVLEMNGAQLQKVLKQGTVGGEGALSPSGIRDRDGQYYLGDVSLKPQKTYRVATTHFLSHGGDGMSELDGQKIVEEFGFPRDLLVDYLQSRATITPPKAGRLPKRR